MKRKIRRRCKCGYGNITNYEKIWICGHNRINKKLSKEHKLNLSLVATGRKHSEKTKKKIGLSKIGNANMLGKNHSNKTKRKISEAHKGMKFSDKHKLNLSLSHLKCNPNYKYCDIWKDKEYKKDIRKDYCEDINCKKNYKRLDNHHIYLNKKKCAPNEIMTLCNSCHAILHHALQEYRHAIVNPQDYIIINRPDHVSYIHKLTREIIRIKRK